MSATVSIEQWSGQPGAYEEPLQKITTPFNTWAPCYQNDPFCCIALLPILSPHKHTVYQAIIPVTESEYTALLGDIHSRIIPKEIQTVCFLQYNTTSTAATIQIVKADKVPFDNSNPNIITFILALHTDPHWSLEDQYLGSLVQVFQRLAGTTRGLVLNVTLNDRQTNVFVNSWGKSQALIENIAADPKIAMRD